VIDFRYHLVSIIAVFLALAVGLVVGSTALSGTAIQFLTARQRAAVAENGTLIKEKGALTNQVNADQAFAQAASQRLVGSLLTQEKVVLIVAPGANGAVTNGVTTILRQAGATVTGQVNLQQSFLTTSAGNETTLTQLAQTLAAKTGLAAPVQSQSPVAGQQAVAQVLAAGVLDSTSGGGLSVKASTDIITGLQQTGFVSTGAITQLANLAVLVVPGGPPPPTETSDVLVTLAAQLKQASSGTVMAGAVESIGSDSVISNENSSADSVSTVDNADTETGQIMVVQALTYTLDGKAPAAYGIDSGNAPSPAPTPSGTPTPGSSGATGGHS
jgi:Copper transport outer membrane protein, MctB